MRDALRQYVSTGLGDPDSILVADDTGVSKPDSHAAGVVWQYGGTLGKVANWQLGVFLGYTSPRGHLALDRALFLPQEALRDRDRCRTDSVTRGPP
jgi:SRSO17 transposase